MTLDYLTFPSPQPASHALVLLHGWGANAQDLAPLVEMLALSTCTVILPNAPLPHPYSLAGRMWYDLETGEHFDTACSELEEALQILAERLKLPLRNLMLGGFSQGGAMAMAVGWDLPLAGLISLSGYLHPSASTPVPWPKPVLLIHGQQDPVVPIQAAHQARQQLASSGFSVEYLELPMAHEINAQALAGVRRFIQGVLEQSGP
ncbi:alpha/beta hydrolase [Lyngbya confervoides]|uniref:Dienelactone hydrolase family protein n=1 Tax=Lyngbya confervoides BDU141951 TaxID=1574623 RepID=A0ABD4SYS6_9CYAN|nr:dienelactone hydrolase family protein [Lyngbya confervoides]MCM1981418.1 dienelactone hydrolase family protein [Lyngbya confervoides BDU141951]